MNNDNCSGGSSFALGLVLGGVIGAGVAMLFAPCSGAETRQKIREFGGDVKDRATDYVHRAGDSIGEVAENSKAYVAERKAAISAAVEAGVEAYKKELEKAKSAEQSNA